VNQRLAAVPMEPNGVLVEPQPDGTLLATIPTQGRTACGIRWPAPSA